MNSLALSMILAFMPNEAGGKIVLTDEMGSCEGDYRAAMSYASTGEVAFGCWTYQQGLVLVQWTDKEKRVYESNLFTVTEEAAQSISP